MKDKQIKNFFFTFTKIHCMHPVSLSFKENGHSNMSYSEDITCTLKSTFTNRCRVLLHLIFILAVVHGSAFYLFGFFLIEIYQNVKHVFSC